MTLQEYLNSIRHKTVAVVGIGVSNTPLIRLLLQEGVAVTACDKAEQYTAADFWPFPTYGELLFGVK